MFENNHKALFICNSTHHVQFFNLIIKELSWDYKIININKWNKFEIEKIFDELKLNYSTIESLSKNNVVKILENEKPDILVTHHDQTPMADLFIREANSKSIPTLMVQDGIYDFHFAKKSIQQNPIMARIKYLISIPLRFIRLFESDYSLKTKFEMVIFELKYSGHGKSLVYGKGKTSKIAVFGQYTKDVLVRLGVEPTKIAITGNPKFDELCKSKKQIKSSKKTRILVLTQCFVEMGIWNTKQRKKFTKTVIKSVHERDDVDLLIKLHPKEKESDYINFLKEIPSNAEVKKNIPLYDAINESDIVITVSSTAGFEAFVMGKPLVIFDLFNNSPPFFHDISLVTVKEEASFIQFIKKIIDDNELIDSKNWNKEHIEYYTYKLDSNASKRIANLINEMVNGD